MLNNIKQAIKELDFFEHPSLLRYQTEPGYRTLTGGLVSVTLIVAFAALFAQKVIFTLTNMTPAGETNVVYSKDPTFYELKADARDAHFMFAFGVTGLDLATQRLFDIQMQTFTDVRSSSGEVTQTSQLVPAQKCEQQQWNGLSDDISSSFGALGFGEWLCPPKDYAFPLQGKYTSQTFKYARIIVQKCGTVSDPSTCAAQSEVDAFVKDNEGVTANFYYVNPVINAGDTDYLNHYLQDSNYFTFSTVTGVNANLYFADYSIETDHSIFPWKDTTTDEGAMTVAPANLQTYSVTGNEYARIYLRKANQSYEITRSFAKVDETLAFIGGLLGFVLLLLTFLNVYNKFSFEIEFGDRLFKQNSGGSFGAQHFNFIVFLGYGLYNVLTIFGVHLKWATMRKFHACRVECLKQLDVHLLFKKMEFFEEVGSIVLEDHHIKGIFMLPKKRLRQAQDSRRRFLLQTLLYHQLDRKARQIFVEQKEYKQRHEQFLRQQEEAQHSGSEENYDNEFKKLKIQCSRSYKKLRDQSQEGQRYSKKIVDKIGTKQMLEALFLRLNIKENKAEQPRFPLPSISDLKIDQMDENQEGKQSF